MDTTCKNGTEHNPKINTGPPHSTAQGTEDRAKACDVQELDHEDFPGGQRDIVNPVIMHHSRSRFVRGPEEGIHDLAINEKTKYQCQ